MLQTFFLRVYFNGCLQAKIFEAISIPTRKSQYFRQGTRTRVQYVFDVLNRGKISLNLNLKTLAEAVG